MEFYCLSLIGQRSKVRRHPEAETKRPEEIPESWSEFSAGPQEADWLRGGSRC